jgi:hypothetical protein
MTMGGQLRIRFQPPDQWLPGRSLGDESEALPPATTVSPPLIARVPFLPRISRKFQRIAPPRINPQSAIRNPQFS